jgi:hypothetical protein
MEIIYVCQAFRNVHEEENNFIESISAVSRKIMFAFVDE